MISRYRRFFNLILSAAVCIVPAVAQQPVKHLDSPARGGELDGRTIALWNSHGAYFNGERQEWIFQRAPLNTTIEDVFTSAYVLDYLAPMLENAGAWVMIPRERDTSTIEVIIDGDSKFTPGYAETSGGKTWRSVPTGYGYSSEPLQQGENQMAMGKSRMIEAVSSSGGASQATWSAEIPEAGTYTIYVSYPKLENVTSRATYIVNSLRGEERVVVNQTMGAGTWMRLGEFPLGKGDSGRPIVTLTNETSDHAGKMVGADAVKIGGGMGSVARGDEPATSGYPRWLEGARYNLQYSGFPQSVYSPEESETDYTDDIRCRPLWVNYLAGGSSANPKEKGLNIPIDLALALHTDAGTTPDTTIVGTLGIYCTNAGGPLGDGRRRTVNKKLTEGIVDQIVNDARQLHQAGWTKRKLRDRRYAEARYGVVPSTLIEMFSHQNYADMRLGLDPEFQFDIARSIYKGIVRFLTGDSRRGPVIQPLPVNSLGLSRGEKAGEYRLTWRATADPLESSARPSDYIIEERIGIDGAFKPIASVSTPSYEIKNVPEGEVRSYRVVARNRGGVSFPSETVALGWLNNHRPEALIVNGFTRLSGPASFDDGSRAGFLVDEDNGVSYGRSVAYIGEQYDFDRESQWVSDDEQPGHGASRKDYIGKMLAGNSMDYAVIHGSGFLNAGQSFVSTSLKDYIERPDKYNQPIVDLILGKQKGIIKGNVDSTYQYQPFPPELVDRLSDFVKRGGNLLISGSNVGSELMNSPLSDMDDRLQKFGTIVLGLSPDEQHIEKAPRVTSQAYWAQPKEMRLPLSITPNAEIYAIQRGEMMTPAVNAATAHEGDYVEEIALYQSGRPAAYALHRQEKGDVVMVGFPIETIMDDDVRNGFIAGILRFLDVVAQPIAPRYEMPLPKIDPIPTKDPRMEKPSHLSLSR